MTIYHALIQLDWELTSFSLVIPFFNPVQRTQGCEGLEENLTWLKLFTLGVDTLVVINVGLGTVLTLVLGRETRVELWGLELECSWVERHLEVRL